MKKTFLIIVLTMFLWMDMHFTLFVFAVKEKVELGMDNVISSTESEELQEPEIDNSEFAVDTTLPSLERSQGYIITDEQTMEIVLGKELAREISIFEIAENEGEDTIVEREALGEDEAVVEEVPTIRKLYNGLPLFSSKDIQRPKGSKNVGADTNNPGNLMDGRGKGAIGVYKSPNGRYYSVFATVAEGYAALIHEIESRKETTLPARLHLTAFLGGWVLGKDGQLDKNSYYYKYAVSRIGEDVSITTISTELLAEIIMEGEATTQAYQKGGKDLRHLVMVNEK